MSGGKDSLALWDVLVELGYQTTGLYLGLGIGGYSDRSREKVEAFASARELPLRVVDLADEGPGLAVPDVAALDAPRRPAPPAARSSGTSSTRPRSTASSTSSRPATTSTTRRRGSSATCCAGSVDHLARQRPVLQPTHPKFVRKVKPLYLLSEYETAVYAFMRGIDYVVEECPNAEGATQLVYKDALNRLEAASPGTKLAFVTRVPPHRRSRSFARRAATAAARRVRTRAACRRTATSARSARSSREVETKRARRAAAAEHAGA